MGNEPSKGTDDQRRKLPKKKSVEQPTTDDCDEATEAPSRVHIFQSKPRPGDSSKSGGQQLQFSSFRTNRPNAFSHRHVQSIVFAGALRSPVFNLKDELERLRYGIEKGTKAIYEAAMKVEDLEAITQGLRRTRDRFSKKRS